MPPTLPAAAPRLVLDLPPHPPSPPTMLPLLKGIPTPSGSPGLPSPPPPLSRTLTPTAPRAWRRGDLPAPLPPAPEARERLSGDQESLLLPKDLSYFAGYAATACRPPLPNFQTLSRACRPAPSAPGTLPTNSAEAR